MDELKKCALFYQKLLNKDYLITVAATSNTPNMTLCLNFGAEHFHHLLGLGKLKDIPFVYRMNRTRFFHDILNDKITFNTISSSSYFLDIADRFAAFEHYIDIMNNDIVLNFDKKKPYYCTIDANLLFYKPIGTDYLHSFFKSQENGIYIPVTFFPRSNKDKIYIDRQKVLKIVNIEIKDKFKEFENTPSKTIAYPPIKKTNEFER